MYFSHFFLKDREGDGEDYEDYEKGWKKVSCRDYSRVLLTECYFEGLIKFPPRPGEEGGTAVTKPFTMKNLTRLAFRRARREKIMGKFAKGSRESSRTTHRNVAWKLKHFRFEEKLRLPSAILLDEHLNRGNKIGFTKDHELKCLGEGG